MTGGGSFGVAAGIGSEWSDFFLVARTGRRLATRLRRLCRGAGAVIDTRSLDPGRTVIAIAALLARLLRITVVPESIARRKRSRDQALNVALIVISIVVIRPRCQVIFNDSHTLTKFHVQNCAMFNVRVVAFYNWCQVTLTPVASPLSPLTIGSLLGTDD